MLNRAEQLGLVTELMLQFPQTGSLSLAFLQTWIMPAIEHQQICFLFDSLGGGNDTHAPLAFWTWAYLSEETERRWLNDPHITFHETEWNEGDRLWIIDLVVHRGLVPSVINHINAHMFKPFDTLYSLRRTNNGAVRKRSTWRRRPVSRRECLLMRHPPHCFSASRSALLDQQGNPRP